MTNFENSRPSFERCRNLLKDEQACHVALSESNEPGHKQIYSRQLKELNLNYSADASVQFYRSRRRRLKFLESDTSYIYILNKIILDKYFSKNIQLHRLTSNLKNSTKKGRTFTISLIEIFLDLYENGNESYLQVISTKINK